MTEAEPPQPSTIEEAIRPYTKELEATFSSLRERFGVTNPDHLPENDRGVQNALEDRSDWEVQVDGLAGGIGTEEAKEEANFLRSSFYVTVGFTDRMYLVEVYDWLSQDEERVSQLGFDSLAARIRAVMELILNTLDKE